MVEGVRSEGPGTDTRPRPARTRHVGIDVLRVVGLVAVAAGHLWGAVDGQPNTVRMLTFSWQVPLFFFLSGYFWTPGRPLAGEVSSRARSLLVPFLAWTLTLGVIVFGPGALHGGPPFAEIGKLVWGGGVVRGWFAPYWFLPILFASAVLYRWLESRVSWPVTVGIATAGLVLCYVTGEALSHVPHDLFFAVPCLLFMLAGRGLRVVEPRIPVPGLLGALALAVSLALVLTRVSAPLDMKLGDFGTPVLSVLVACLICGGLLLVTKAVVPASLPEPVGGLTTEAGQTLVVVLLTHTFFFQWYRDAGLPSPAVFALSLVSSMALGILLHRTPLSRWYVGIPRKRADRVRR